MVMNYENLVLRNLGYINQELQEKIKNSHILIAGCGVGSSIAEAALRMGFINITLLDGDTVEEHNLNRQCYTFKDVKKSKAKSLAKRLKSIFPSANIKVINKFLNKKNVKQIVSNVDIIFDTIDFLDLPAITYLHDEAFNQKKPIVTAASAGWGAVAIFFDPTKQKENCGFRDLFELPAKGSVENLSYIEKFSPFLSKIEHLLDKTIIKAMAKSFDLMEDNKPCPAPHLSVGSFSVAALCLKIIVAYLNNEEIKHAEPIVINLNEVIK